MSIARKGIPLSEEHKKILSEVRRKDKNPSAKLIKIYDSNNELQYICAGNFKEVCLINNLPYDSLVKSIKTGSPIYQNLKSSSKIILERTGNIIYAGWYVIDCGFTNRKK